MAERSNAHDSKSCYAGMYTRVQIPFSAPSGTQLNPERDLIEFHFFYNTKIATARKENACGCSVIAIIFFQIVLLLIAIRFRQYHAFLLLVLTH